MSVASPSNIMLVTPENWKSVQGFSASQRITPGPSKRGKVSTAVTLINLMLVTEINGCVGQTINKEVCNKSHCKARDTIRKKSKPGT